MHAQTAAQILEHSTEGSIGGVSLLHVSPGMGKGAYMSQRAAT